MKLRVLVAGLVLGLAAFAADSGAELFQKAVTAERAAGNLEEAIKLYQRVAKEFASDRALAAKALVQEARCYEKLGQDKAVKIYEQVARDYRDQREPSATASARLAVLRRVDRDAGPATMTQRKIELPGGGVTDGQRVVYTDDATGAEMIGDFAGREKRVFFKPKAGVVEWGMLSRDFSTVLMGLTRPDGSRFAAVIKTDGTGYREIRGDNHCQPDISWDNRYVLVCEVQPDGTRQLLRVSMADGETRKVRETDAFSHAFSPDGRFIAMGEQLPGKILVMPSQGGEPQLVFDNARLLDWTRDGRFLIIVRGLSGSDALYLLPIKDGRQAGDPVFVRYGSFMYGRTTAAGGALSYYSTPQGGNYAAWLGTLNSDGRLGGWKRLSLSGSSGSGLFTRWSPDSTEISYSTQDQAAGHNSWAVRLRNIASGEERELYHTGTDEPGCIWAAQHPSLVCVQYTPTTLEVLSISIDSGRVERLGSLPAANNWNVFFGSRDDRAIYMLRGSELIRWEIGTQHATTLDRIPGFNQGDSGSPYPVEQGDSGSPYPVERWMARRDKGTIEIRPMSGGDWKPLISLSETQMAFTPDGNWFLYHGVDAAGKHGLFRVATAGGQPERLGDFPSTYQFGYLRISPDGKKIIVEAPNPSPDVWLLENFEPKAQAAR